MPTYNVTVIQILEVVKTIQVEADDDSNQNIEAAVNAKDESDFTTDSSTVVSEETLTFTEVS